MVVGNVVEQVREPYEADGEAGFMMLLSMVKEEDRSAVLARVRDAVLSAERKPLA